MPRRPVLLVALIAALASSAWVAWLTHPPGPGLSPDGMSYIGAARAIATGEGPRVPFANYSDADSTSRLRDYPPGFSLGIAVAFRGLHSSPEQGARAVEVVSAGASVGLAALVVGSIAGPVAGAAGALALLVTPAFVEDHSIALSEPLYLALLVGVLALMTLDGTPVILIGLLCAAGVMVRYAGLSLAGGAGIFILLQPGPPRRRLARATLASVPALAAFLLWSRWAGGAREYGWTTGIAATFLEGWGTVQAWFAPSVPAGAVRVVLVLLGAGALLLLLFRAGQRQDMPRAGRLLRATASLAACFAALMIFSRLYADDAIIFDNRLLSPLFVLGTIAAATAGGTLWRGWAPKTRALVATLGAAWLAGSLGLVRLQLRDLGDDGWGYASRDWQASEMAQWLHGEGSAYALFSDNGPAAWSLVHRPSRFVPETLDSAAVAGLARAIQARRSAIISFADPYTPSNPRGEAFARRLGLQEAMRSDEGSVWVTSALQQQPDHGTEHGGEQRHDH